MAGSFIRLVGGGAFALATFLAKSVGATDPTDVIATLPISSGTFVAASIRTDEVSCLSFFGPQSWFVLIPSSNALWLVDTKAAVRSELTSASIVQWRDARARAAAKLREGLGKLSAEPEMPRIVKEAIVKYSDPLATGTTVPRIKLIATPLSGAVMIPEIQALNRRLSDLRVELRQQLAGADLAIEALTCALEFDQLPSQLKSPNSSNISMIVGVKPGDPGPHRAWMNLKTAASSTLSALFTSRRPLPLPSSVVPKP